MTGRLPYNFIIIFENWVILAGKQKRICAYFKWKRTKPKPNSWNWIYVCPASQIHNEFMFVQSWQKTHCIYMILPAKIHWMIPLIQKNQKSEGVSVFDRIIKSLRIVKCTSFLIRFPIHRFRKFNQMQHLWFISKLIYP